MHKHSGWKPIPLSLKIVFVLSILWIIGSLFAIPMRFEMGLPFFGLYLTSFAAISVLFALDFVGPLVFLIGLWNRAKYALYAACLYITIFVANSISALFTVRDELGVVPILMPAAVYVVFALVIFLNKKYFSQKNRHH